MTPIVFDYVPSAQDVFESCVGFLATQKHQSAMIMDGSRACRYRMDDGRRCAVGVFLEGKVYRYSMEGSDIYHLVNSYWSLPEWMEEYASLLESLQQAHDYAASAVGVQRELMTVASDFGLDNSAVDQVREFACIGKSP
jgi:hypothetical protein